ncbi:hypothetical protein RF55_14462 [Lasius niger]|uniref:Uncharacterized protein n=1 Tax=Lasius niger TaxID=67767 RepID=A0A0J7K838_LASNI|nr:hypothetical protein RF55_14462 [Lasius niger]
MAGKRDALSGQSSMEAGSFEGGGQRTVGIIPRRGNAGDVMAAQSLFISDPAFAIAGAGRMLGGVFLYRRLQGIEQADRFSGLRSTHIALITRQGNCGEDGDDRHHDHQLD